MNEKEFTEKEVERILRLSRDRQVKEHGKKIDTSFKLTTDLDSLLKIAEERDIDPSIVKNIVESGKYVSKITILGNFVKDNLRKGVAPGIAGLSIGLIGKYAGLPYVNPFLFSAMAEVLVDGIDCFIRGKEIKQLVKTAPGSYLSRSLGLYIGMF